MEVPKPPSNDESSLPPNRYLKRLDIKLVDGEFENPIRGQVRDPKQVCEVFRSLKNKAHETMLGVFLAPNLELRSYDILSTGNEDTTLFIPDQVFDNCITLKAREFILIHNHPSGDPTPTPQDKRVIKILAEQSKIMRRKFLDFIIIGQDGHWSMFEELEGGSYTLGAISDLTGLYKK